MTHEELVDCMEKLAQAEAHSAEAKLKLGSLIDEYAHLIGPLPQFPGYLALWLEKGLLDPLSERASSITLMIAYYGKKAGAQKALELSDLFLAALDADPEHKQEALAEASAAYVETSIEADIFPLYKPHIQRIARQLPASCPRFAALLLKGFGKESEIGDLAELFASMLADLDLHSPEFNALVQFLCSNPGEPNSPRSTAFQALQLAILEKLMDREVKPPRPLRLPIDYARAAAKAPLPPEALQRLKILIAQLFFQSFCGALKSAEKWSEGLEVE